MPNGEETSLAVLRGIAAKYVAGPEATISPEAPAASVAQPSLQELREIARPYAAQPPSPGVTAQPSLEELRGIAAEYAPRAEPEPEADIGLEELRTLTAQYRPGAPAPSPAREAMRERVGLPPGRRPAATVGQAIRQRQSAIRQQALQLPEGSPERIRLEEHHEELSRDLAEVTAGEAAVGRAEAAEEPIRRAYTATRAAARGLTLGATELALRPAERALLGEEVVAQGRTERFAEGLGELLGTALTGVQIMKGLRGAGAALNLGRVGTQILARIGTATLIAGAKNVIAWAQDPERVSGRDALGNVAQAAVSSAIAMVPEMVVPPGFANFAAQVVTDLATDAAIDLGLRDRLSEQSLADWFISEIPALASSVTFAGMDLADKGQLRANQAAFRELGQRFKARLKGAAPAVAPRAELAPARPAPMTPAEAKAIPEARGFNESRLRQAPAAIKNWAKRKFGRTRGLGDELWRMMKGWRSEKEAGRLAARATGIEFANARKALIAKTSRQTADADIYAVLSGERTVDEFATRYDLRPDDPMLTAINKFSAERAQRSKQLAGLLEKEGVSDELVTKIAENDYYLTRFYEAHILGEDFVPRPEDVSLAVAEVRGGLERTLGILGKRATKLTAETGARVGEYLETGDAKLLAGLNADDRARAMKLGIDFYKYRDIVDSLVAEGDSVRIQAAGEDLRNAAESTVAYFLGRTGERVPAGTGARALDPSSLSRRTLRGAFRHLYGEVRDPAAVAAKTTESQRGLLADHLLTTSIFRQGEGRWWSNLPNRETGTMRAMPNDPKRYGGLAGKFVSPEVERVIRGSGVSNRVAQVYYGAKSMMRLLKLFGPRTILRNYTTALTGFALGSGDVYRKGYAQNLRKSHALLRGVLRGNPNALRELSELARIDVFRAQTSSTVDDIQRLLSTSPKATGRRILQSLGEKYALIDMPTKVASYWTNRDRFAAQGMSPREAEAAAAEHVRKFYQHAESVPEFARDLSRLPLADYPGYFVDSIRITGNQIANAYRSAQQGDIAPLAGLASSRAIGLATTTAAAGLLTEAWAKFHRKLREKDGEVAEVEKLDKVESMALREFMPTYYQGQPMVAWTETEKDGTKQIYYTVTGNQSAFPLEDMIVGAWQASTQPSAVPAEVGREVARQRLTPGMLESTIWRAATGDELMGTFKTTGPIEALPGQEVPDKAGIWLEALGWGGAEVLGGQFTGKIRQLGAIAKREERGREGRAGTYTPRRNYEDVFWSMAAPVRTYAIDAGEFARLVRFKAANIAGGIREAKRAISRGDKVVYHQQYRLDKLHELQRLAGSARIIAEELLPPAELQAVLRDAGLSLAEAQAAVFGNISGLTEYVPQEYRTQLQRAREGSYRPRRRRPGPRRRRRR